MTIKNTREQYGSVTQFFHWVIFFLVLCMLILGFFMDDVTPKWLKGEVVNIHKLLGLTILILMVLRIIWAVVNRKPELPPGTPKWERFIERPVHWLLYALLIAMPLSGWIMSSAAGKPPHYMQWAFPLPVPQSKSLAEQFVTVHNTLAFVIIAFVSLHILAALYHHFIRKDNILKRMLP